MGWRMLLTCALASAAFGGTVGPARAADLSGAMVRSAGCAQHTTSPIWYAEPAALPFEINFYGRRFDDLFIAPDGHVSFGAPAGHHPPLPMSYFRPIIAPFFADADVRNGVMYGETTYEGRRAFCVTWEDVGYWQEHYDKLNSFQLLVVDRAEGDFDIVFNYGSIRWESGDSIRGGGGLGGYAARVGYANGDGSAVNAYELPGSGMNGRLLDSNPNGLIHNSLRSQQRGRYVFHVRNGDVVDKYVALGDSYNSGLGAYDYEPGTDIAGTNQCQRSYNAYAHLLVDRGDTPWNLDFVACAGAVIDTLYSETLSTSDAPFNENQQIDDHVADDAALVILGIGGNDLGFADVLSGCLSKNIAIGSCEDAYDDDVFNKLFGLLDHNNPAQLNRLQQLYSDIRTRAPRAQVVTTGYPKFFPDDGGKDLSSFIDGNIGALVGDGRCQGVRLTDQLWMNQKVAQLNRAIAASSRSMGVDYVPSYSASDGHELCSSDDPPYLHGFKPRAGLPPAERESFHPTAYGHEVMADRIAARLDPPPPPPDPDVASDPAGKTTSQSHNIEQDELLDLAFDVGQALSIGFNTLWPGSDVEMSLVSPSGKVYSRQTLASGLFHRNGPTFETYVLQNPEPGRWHVRLRGADVDPGGELTQLHVFEESIPNELPVAEMSATQATERTVVLSAAGSADADGTIARYLWEFGDGTAATGPEVTHRYKRDGQYRVTLVVQDDDGGLGFAAADQDISVTIPKYPFTGFHSPVNNPPTVNTARAGRAIPVKFGLGGDEGLDVFEAGYPKVQRIDCASGATFDEVEETAVSGSSPLTYDALTGRYQYIWKSDLSWAGSCRQLVVRFNDGSRHIADFSFR